MSYLTCFLIIDKKEEKIVWHMNVMWKNIWKRGRMKYERIYEKEREWTEEINHELLIPQSNYAMIKEENLINQVK